MKSVALNSKATVKVTAERKHDKEPTVDAIVRFRRKDDRTRIGGDKPLTLTSGKGELKWVADGLKDDELECEVTWEVLVDEEIHEQGELRVYRPEIEVVAKDEEGEPIENARLRFRMRVRDDARTQFGLHKPRRVVRKDTNGSGKLKVNYLPSQSVKLTWEPPWELVAWPKKTGPKREATLKLSPFVLAAVDPPEGALRQWVNAAPDPLHRELGHVLKIDVRGHAPGDPATDAGAKQTYHVKLERAQDGSLRTTDTSPACNGQVVAPGTETVQPFELGKDHDGSFEIDVGAGGGDTFTVSAGSTVECSDLSWTIETWRRLHVHLLPATAAMQIQQGDLATMKARVENALRDGYVEVVWHGPTPLGGNAGCLTVPQARISQMGIQWNALPNYCIYQVDAGRVAHKLELEDDVTAALVNDHEPRIYVVLCHLIVWREIKEPTIRFRGRDSGWKSFPVARHEGKWTQVLFDGSSPLIPGLNGVASYESLDGVAIRASGFVPANDFQIDNAKKKYRVRVNDNAIGTFHKVDVTFKFAYPHTIGGSSSGNRISLVWTPADTAEKVGHALAHEIGHSLEQSATGAPSKTYPGIDTAHPFAHTHRNFSGSHCYYGLPAKYHAHPDFAKLTVEKKHGSCVMWGGIAPGFDLARTARFCEHCRKYLRAAACEPTRI